MLNLRNLDQLLKENLKDKIIFIRVDLNVPIKDEKTVKLIIQAFIEASIIGIFVFFQIGDSFWCMYIIFTLILMVKQNT